MTHRGTPRRKKRYQITRRAGRVFAALLAANSIVGGCLSSEIGKRFRDAYVPGLVAGLSTAVTTPDQADAGLRQSLAALIEGLGAALSVRE